MSRNALRVQRQHATPPAPVATDDALPVNVPDAEKSFLAGLLEQIADEPDEARRSVALLDPRWLTVPFAKEVYGGVITALKLPGPKITDVTTAIRNSAKDRAVENIDPAVSLVADLLKSSATTRQAYSIGMARYASEIEAAFWQRATIDELGRALTKARTRGLDSFDVDIISAATESLRDAVERRTTDGRELVVVMASDVTPQPIEWIWPQRISAGALCLVAGYVGQAKSLLCLDILSRVTNGGRWPDASGTCKRGSAIWLGGEDGLEKAFIKRVDAAGIDKSRLAIVKGTRRRNEDGQTGILNLQRDVGLLLRQLDAMSDCRAIVFDPLSDYLGCDPNKREEVRPALMPLIEAANNRDIALIGIMHLSKKNDAVGVQRLAGSTAFSELARHIIVVGNDPSDEDKTLTRRRLMLVTKNSYGLTEVGQAFRVLSRFDDIEQPHLEWIAGTIEGMDCDTLLAKPKPPGGAFHQERRSDAVDALNGLLADGERSGKEVEEELKTAGFGRRQIQHAADTLGVVRSWGTFNGKRASIWSLPAAAPCSTNIAGTVGEFSVNDWPG